VEYCCGQAEPYFSQKKTKDVDDGRINNTNRIHINEILWNKLQQMMQNACKCGDYKNVKSASMRAAACTD
jgi:aerobic-type carbon monoxide dehydrogenase small subunit (CoxS/CutS family)